MAKTKSYKRILFLLTLLVMVFLFKPPTLLAFSGAGSGTEANPYVITNVNQLQEMENNTSAYYVLGNDIDASETVNWGFGSYTGFDPIETFRGTFDGQRFKITGLYIRTEHGLDSIGLFASLNSSGVVKNVGLENVDIYSESGNGIAALVGSNDGTVTRSYSTGRVEGDDSLGGLVGGNSDGTVTNSYSRVDIFQQSTTWGAGGLVASNGYYGSANITNSYSTGNVTPPWESIGGLLGIGEAGICVNSFWDTETSGMETSGGGTGKETDEMKNVATFTDTSTSGLNTPWDFVGNPNDDTGDEDIWDIDGVTNDGYPFFYVVAAYVDIGLRVYDAGAGPIAIAAWPLGEEANSPLRIAKDTDDDEIAEIYGIALVDPGDPNDSGVRIKTGSGDIKALRKL